MIKALLGTVAGRVVLLFVSAVVFLLPMALAIRVYGPVPLAEVSRVDPVYFVISGVGFAAMIASLYLPGKMSEDKRVGIVDRRKGGDSPCS